MLKSHKRKQPDTRTRKPLGRVNCLMCKDTGLYCVNCMEAKGDCICAGEAVLTYCATCPKATA